MISISKHTLAMVNLRLCVLVGLLGFFLCSGIATGQENSSREYAPGKPNPQPQVEGATKGTGPAAEATQPNIVLINLDDADLDIFSDEILERYLPSIKRLATDGWRFTNCHATTPLCGPSRVCLLRGQHAHKTGTKTNRAKDWLNNGFTGAYPAFKQRGFEQEHLGVWMQRAGYRTMVVGKYLHGEYKCDELNGWDDLFISFGGRYFGTLHYNSRLNRKRRLRPNKDHVYRTVAEADEVVTMIQSHAKRLAQASKDMAGKSSLDSEQPFFLYVAPFAPHLPARGHKMVQKKYVEIAGELEIVKTPDVNEADVTDKPPHLWHFPLTAKHMEKFEEEFRNRVRATKSVDDLVKRLLSTLADNGMRENTYIFFTSDNGYQLTHNRLSAKKIPYHRNTLIPLFVVGPGVGQGSSDHLLAHIDLTATFLDLAGGKASIELDGRSLVPILRDPGSIDEDRFRESLLIQNWEDKNCQGRRIHARYASLRMKQQIFTQWSNGEREFYDLATDPYQLENKIDSLTSDQRKQLSQRLHDLKQGVATPVVTVGNSELVGSSPKLQGVAGDDNSVQRVELEIHDIDRNLYWNGGGWQDEKRAVDADLKNKNGLICDWEYPVDFSEVKDKGNVTVTARSFDDLASVSREAELKLSVDAIAPTTELRPHLNGSEVQSPAVISGACSDDFELSGVEVTLQRTDDQHFFNGSSWVSHEASFMRVSDEGKWHVEIPVAVGSYRVVAISVDLAGNRDPSPATAEFSVK